MGGEEEKASTRVCNGEGGGGAPVRGGENERGKRWGNVWRGVGVK